MSLGVRGSPTVSVPPSTVGLKSPRSPDKVGGSKRLLEVTRRLEKRVEKSDHRLRIVLTCSLVIFPTEELNNLMVQSELTQGKAV